MGIKKQLQSSMYSILKHNKDGSFATRANRQKMAYLMASDLMKGGYKLKNISHLKAKHIMYLTRYWQQKKLSEGTLKNRLSVIRWFCEKLNKKHIVPTNQSLAIQNRVYVSQQDKSLVLLANHLAQIKDPYVYLSLKLEEQFGLRREEAMKIKLFISDHGDHLSLEKSWCKGGRAREIPILTSAQRDVLEQCKRFLEPVQNLL